MIAVAVGSFADPSSPRAMVSGWEQRRHQWVEPLIKHSFDTLSAPRFVIRRSDIQGCHEDIARIGIGVSNPRSKCSPSGRQGPGAAAAKEAVATTGQPSFFVKS